MDWKFFLKQHPVFSPLAETEIDNILDANVSTQRQYEKNQTVIRTGESGNSFFLIGSGSVQVSLPEADNRMIPLRILRKGEFFGEIAVFDQSPRSATVITIEPCFFLEIKGQYLNELVNDHPEIELKFLMHLSTRMRDLSDQVMAVKVKDVDEKIKAVNTRLDAELKIFDVSLKAAQTVFDHTSTRASEVIESVEKSRSRMTAMASIIGAGLSTIVAVFGFMGINEFNDIKKFKEEIFEIREELTENLQALTADSVKINKVITELEPMITKSNTDLVRVNEQIKVFQKDFGLKFLLPRFKENFFDDTQPDLKTYASILKIENEQVEDELFEFLSTNILFDDKTICALILYQGLDLTTNHRQKILSYYLLLTALALNDGSIGIKPVVELEGIEEVEYEDAPEIPAFRKIKEDLLLYLENHQDPVMPFIKYQYSFEKMKVEIEKTYKKENLMKYKEKITKIEKMKVEWRLILEFLENQISR